MYTLSRPKLMKRMSFLVLQINNYLNLPSINVGGFLLPTTKC